MISKLISLVLGPKDSSVAPEGIRKTMLLKSASILSSGLFPSEQQENTTELPNVITRHLTFAGMSV
jgi:hypothetical protein